MQMPKSLSGAIAPSCVLALASCSSLKPSTLRYEQVDAPGFFDIGVGYGRVSDTRNTDNDDAQGLIASFKAYPLGRWYGEPKASAVQSGVLPDDRAAVGAIQRFSPDDRKALRDSRGANVAGNAAASREVRDAYQRLERLLWNADAEMGSNVREALRKLVNGEAVDSSEENALLGFARGTGAAPKWHVIKERDEWYNRFSIFYGRSVNDFDSGGLQSEVNVVGIGFDVSPDLTLQAGWSFYEVDETGLGQIDSDSSLFIGVSLNLYAFKSLGEAILSVGN